MGHGAGGEVTGSPWLGRQEQRAEGWQHAAQHGRHCNKVGGALLHQSLQRHVCRGSAGLAISCGGILVCTLCASEPKSSAGVDVAELMACSWLWHINFSTNALLILWTPCSWCPSPEWQVGAAMACNFCLACVCLHLLSTGMVLFVRLGRLALLGAAFNCRTMAFQAIVLLPCFICVP